MKALVTGVKGQLGYDVVNELQQRGHEAIGVDIEEMDITDAECVNRVITEAAPDVVIHCAAWTAVDAAEDEENQEIDVYYLDKRVCHDYDHVGHYFRTAIIMFRRIRNITADWVNLKNLWLLRDCIRENFNHGLEVDDLIFGETFDGEDPETIKPLTKERLFKIKKVIQEKDPYATV